MTLIIEDGSVVAGANSYATVEQAREYATARGIELAPETDVGDDTVAQMLIRAGDYLNSLEANYSGSRVDPLEQTMSYPRRASTVWGHTLIHTVIPNTLINAQCQLCIELASNIDIMPSIAGGADRAIIRDKTGPLETEWSEALLQSGDMMPTLPAVNALITALFGSTGTTLRTVRV